MVVVVDLVLVFLVRCFRACFLSLVLVEPVAVLVEPLVVPVDWSLAGWGLLAGSVPVEAGG